MKAVAVDLASAVVPRRSSRVRTIAGLLEIDESQVRRLIDAGELESHKIGKRGVRVFLDSVAAYQARQSEPERKLPPKQRLAAKRRAVTSAAHQNAMRDLRRLGVIQ